MHWDNNSKQGCITVKVYRTPDKIRIISKDLATSIIVKGKSTSPSLFMTVNKENEDLSIKCNTNSKLKVNCGIVCSISKLDKVLKVSPDFIFLSKSNGFTDDVYIISNVVWNIN